ncbi:MAG: 16S rRNA processing protein RimM [Alistipes sp.]|nr:16S rRNA processing protein RimM [Alistipes sp.]
MERIAAGKITKPFGNNGQVAAVLYDMFPADYDTREPLYVFIDGLAVPLFISRMERRGRSGALILFEDIDNERRTGIITGLEFHIRPEFADADAPEDGLAAFVGYKAVVTVGDDDSVGMTGTVTDLDGNDANPLFVVTSGDREYLIPASDELITSIEESGQTISFRVPPGLLEL